MTTVIDPAGTAVAIFNKSGTAIVDMAIDVGPSEPLVPIPYFAGVTIARVSATDTGDPNDGGVELPTAADIGDQVEVCQMSADGFRVYPPAGENIDGQASVTGGTLKRFRKISATDWRVG